MKRKKTKGLFPTPSKISRSSSQETNESLLSTDNSWHLQAGMISKVVLRNFMCHQEFIYTPNHRLNFLCGSNGSGKSAVLTAIVFALGGTAKSSGRAASTKGFIRSGQNSCSVEITLLNSGENAYKNNVYGDKITIVRSAQLSGGGSYKIKDTKGKTVMIKKVKEEISRILSLFSIQVDNPIAVLNQETAKSFLHSSDPHKLYQFFMRATQLEDCKRDYNTASEEREVSVNLLKEKLTSIPELKKNLEIWEKKYQFYQSLLTKKDDIASLKGALAWSLVHQVQEELKGLEKNVDAKKNKISKCFEHISKINNQLNESLKEKDSLEKSIYNLAEDSKIAESTLRDSKASLNTVSNEVRTGKRSLSELEAKITSTENEKKALSEGLERLRASNGENDYERRRIKRQKEIETLLEEKRTLESRLQSTLTHLSNLQNNIESIEESRKGLAIEIQSVQYQIDEKKKELNHYLKHKTSKLAVFGNETIRLVKAIQSNLKKFKFAPIGPLGAHLSLVNSEFSELVESELSPYLRSFLVDNFHDKKMLDALCAKLGIRVDIFISSFSDKAHNVLRHKVESSDYKTIYDVLVFENPNVGNCLVDQKRIETILLLPDERTAQILCSSSSRVPSGLQYALIRSEGLISTYYPAPNYRSYVRSYGKGSISLLQVSIEDHTEFLQSQLTSLLSSHESLKEKMNTLINGDLSLSLKEKKNHEETIKTIKPLIPSCDAKISQLKAEDFSEAPPDIAALEEDYEKCVEASELYKKEMKQLSSQLERVLQKFEDAKTKVREEEKNLAELIGGSEPLTESLTSFENQISKLKGNLSLLNHKKEEYSLALPSLEEDVERTQVRLSLQIEKAKKWTSDEVKTLKTSEELHRQIISMEDSIRRQEETHEPIEVVQTSYISMEKKYNSVLESVQNLKDVVEHLNEMLESRKRGFKAIRASVARRVTIAFAHRLSARNYSGEIVFDHKDLTLEIFVCPQGGQMIQKRSLKTLSGGEKSYSTISLILSLWDSMQPPFRILDEFDVFMDMVNRRIALDLITSYAKDARRFQYIFLTPLNTDTVIIDEDLSILRLEKNQG